MQRNGDNYWKLSTSEIDGFFMKMNYKDCILLECLTDAEDKVDAIKEKNLVWKGFIVDAQKKLLFIKATLAQLVEQLIRNEQVAGSSPAIGSFSSQY